MIGNMAPKEGLRKNTAKVDEPNKHENSEVETSASSSPVKADKVILPMHTKIEG